MRRIILITVVLGLATALFAPATAGAANRLLELKITTGVLPSPTKVDTEMNFTLATAHGTAECRTYSEGPITNGAHVDAFTAEYQVYTCETGASSSEGPGGVSALTLNYKGKATSTVSVGVAWPAPYAPCTYSGTVLGTETLSGELNASFTGKLKSSCHEHRPPLLSTYWYMYAAFPGWEQLEDYVGHSG